MKCGLHHNFRKSDYHFTRHLAAILYVFTKVEGTRSYQHHSILFGLPAMWCHSRDNGFSLNAVTNDRIPRVFTRHAATPISKSRSSQHHRNVPYTRSFSSSRLNNESQCCRVHRVDPVSFRIYLWTSCSALRKLVRRCLFNIFNFLFCHREIVGSVLIAGMSPTLSRCYVLLSSRKSCSAVTRLRFNKTDQVL